MGLDVYALTGTGGAQAANGSTARIWSLAVASGSDEEPTTDVTYEGKDICTSTLTDGNLYHKVWNMYYNEDQTATNALYIKVTLTRTGANGCFAGLGKVTLGLTEQFSVDVTSAGWATFAAPYATTIPNGVTAYYATGVTDGKLDLTKITDDVIPAGEGVLLQAAADTYIFARTSNTSSIDDNIFSAAIEETTVEAKVGDQTTESCYVLANKSDVLGFYLLEKTYSLDGYFSRVSALKAYINKNDITTVNAAANAFLGFGDSDITGIESAETAADAAAQNAIHYDLQGRRVAAPQKGQLYIVNGKKVLY